MKLVMLEAAIVSHGDISYDELYEIADVTEFANTSTDEIITNIGDAEAVFCNKTLFTSKVFESCPNLKYIGVCATGYNNIDLVSAKKHGVCVTNVPSYSENAVAQQVFAYILHHANKISQYDNFVKADGWINSDKFAPIVFPTSEIFGSTIGIIGFGRIGKAVAKIAKSFGMEVLVHTRTAQTCDEVKFVSLYELLCSSDYISVCCPLTDETENLINAENLRKCKETAVVINTSRGKIVNESDLDFALKNGVIDFAYLDVLQAEPMEENCPLKANERCVITPHIAWAALETRTRLMKIVTENFKAYLAGSPQNKIV